MGQYLPFLFLEATSSNHINPFADSFCAKEFNKTSYTLSDDFKIDNNSLPLLFDKIKSKLSKLINSSEIK